MAEISIKTSLPKERVRAFMQHLRDFDRANGGKQHFSIMVIAPEMSMEETHAALDVDPPFVHRTVVHSGPERKH